MSSLRVRAPRWGAMICREEVAKLLFQKVPMVSFSQREEVVNE
jgi:hypothetical protein